MPNSEHAAPLSVPLIAVGMLAVAAVLGLGAGFAGPEAVVALVAAIVVAVVATRPQVGAYLYLAATPLVAGIARGEFVPLLRANEALLALIVAGLAVRGYVALLERRPFLPSWRRLDGALAWLAFAGSVLPLLWRFAAGDPISGDDISYAAVFVKLLLLYFVFRVAVRTEREVRTALWIAMAATAVVALLAVFQALGLIGVPQLLSTFYAPFQGETADVGRGSSTLSLSFAVADIMAMGLGIVAGLIRGAPKPEFRALLILGAIFVLGAVAAGQFSGYLGLLVAVLAISVGLRDRRAAVIGIGATLVGGVLLWPVVAGRLSGFGEGGLPPSWNGRISNIRDYVLPELTDRLHWLYGVRPSARIPAPERWREWVFIESGYLWLLWTGGVIMLVAFFYLVFVGARGALRAIGRGPRPIAAAGLGAFTGLSVVVVLTVFDPHLTMRGTSDLLIPLLAMTLVGAGRAPLDREDLSAEWDRLPDAGHQPAPQTTAG